MCSLLICLVFEYYFWLLGRTLLPISLRVSVVREGFYSIVLVYMQCEYLLLVSLSHALPSGEISDYHSASTLLPKLICV
jgi:hypothetical protein